MGKFVPFERAPEPLKQDWMAISDTLFGGHDTSSMRDHHVAVDEIHKTWSQRRFDIENDVYVTVQETLTHVEDGPTVCTVVPFQNMHLFVVNEWALERIEGRNRYDVLAHELCHIQIAEEYGEHSEQDPEFGRLVSQKRAASSTEDVTSEDFWDSYPASA